MGQDQSRPGQKNNEIHNVQFEKGKGTMISMARQRSMDLAKSIFADKDMLRELWHRCDANGNGMASLAEVDKLVIELGAMTKHDHDLYNGFFANMADNKSKMGIMRAYKWTLKKEQLSNNDDFIQAREFPALLKNLYFFSSLEKEFEKADTDRDRKVSKEEFKTYLTNMGFILSESSLNSEFSQLDADDSGFASPLEFYGYCMRALSMTDKDVNVKGDFMNVGFASSSKGRANDYRGSTHHDSALSSHNAPHHAYHSQYHHSHGGPSAAPPPPAPQAVYQQQPQPVYAPAPGYPAYAPYPAPVAQQSHPGAYPRQQMY